MYPKDAILVECAVPQASATTDNPWTGPPEALRLRPHGRNRTTLDQASSCNTAPSRSTISSTCALVSTKGGDIAIVSPVMRSMMPVS